MSDDNEMSGCPFGEAWVVTTGWDNRQPLYIMPTEASAKVYIDMRNVQNGKAVKLQDFLRRRDQDTRRNVITTLDRAWTSARDNATWEE